MLEYSRTFGAMGSIYITADTDEDTDIALAFLMDLEDLKNQIPPAAPSFEAYAEAAHAAPEEPEAASPRPMPPHKAETREAILSVVRQGNGSSFHEILEGTGRGRSSNDRSVMRENLRRMVLAGYLARDEYGFYYIP